MKIERPPTNLQKLLERSLETGDNAPLKAALVETQQAAPAELESFLSSVDAGRRKELERLLGTSSASVVAPAGTGTGTSTGTGTGAATAAGQRILDVRAQKQNPWWKAVTADPATLGAPIHPEPQRDIEVHGEKLTKEDLASMLRSIGR